MSVQVIDNFSYKGKKGNFERDNFDTLQAMRSYPEDGIDDGHVCFCNEDGNHYKFNHLNSVDGATGRWRLHNKSVNTLTETGEGKVLDARQGKILKDLIDAKVIEAGGVSFDTVPTKDSTNPVTSNGIKEAMDEQAESINSNMGVADYPTFSESTAYSAGDVVNYNGKLYKFTTDHAAGAWTGTDAEETDIIKAHIVQELGDSMQLSMSQKAITEKIYYSLLDLINSLVSRFSSYIPYDDKFIICDGKGNVIVQIDENGISTPNVNEIQEKTELIKTSYDDKFIICDGKGNVICEISKDGVNAPNIEDIEEKVNNNNSKTWLNGKNIFVLGDSLSAGGDWMSVLAEKTGAVFDQTINNGTNEINLGKPISWGGTQSYGYNDDNNSGTQRAKNLIELSKSIPIDVLFIQNVNDANSLGSCYTDGEYTYEVQHERLFSEAPQIPRECVTNENVFLTQDEAFNDFKDNILTRIGETPRSHGMMYRFKYSANSTKLKITGKATTDGTFNVIVNGNTYGCAVTTDMSIDEICDKIVEWDYPNYTDTKNSDGSVSFIDLQDNAPNVSFNENGTGITAELSGEQKSGTGFRVYGGYDYDNKAFGNILNWKYWYELGTMYSKYKGLVEYLQENLPNTKIFFVISPVINVNFLDPATDKTFPDGTLDMTRLIQKQNRALAEIQRDVAELYGIPVIDVEKEWGISYFNAYPKYYGNSNVHPKADGYKVWGETIAKILCSK